MSWNQNAYNQNQPSYPGGVQYPGNQAYGGGPQNPQGAPAYGQNSGGAGAYGQASAPGAQNMQGAYPGGNPAGVYGQASAPGYSPQVQQGQPGYQPSYNQQQQGPPPGVSMELWQWFQSVDSDRSGKINATELKAALMNSNYSSFNESTCRLMIRMFDRDNSGTIDINEFSALWKYIGDWRQCFDRFDRDRSGSISANELVEALRTFGYNLSPQFCQTLVKNYAARHNTGTAVRAQVDSINFDDFIEASVTIKNLTDAFRRHDQRQQGTITIGFEQFLEMVVRTTVL